MPAMTTLAQTTAPSTPGPTQPAPPAAQLFSSWATPLMIGLLVLWFFSLRSKKTQDRQRQDMLSQIKRGDRIETIGGVLGKVVDVEETKVLLKVDETSNTKIWFSRKAIHRVTEQDKAPVAADAK